MKEGIQPCAFINAHDYEYNSELVFREWTQRLSLFFDSTVMLAAEPTTTSVQVDKLTVDHTTVRCLDLGLACIIISLKMLHCLCLPTFKQEVSAASSKEERKTNMKQLE